MRPRPRHAAFCCPVCLGFGVCVCFAAFGLAWVLLPFALCVSTSFAARTPPFALAVVRYPALKPLVLVLKQLLVERGLNDP